LSIQCFPLYSILKALGNPKVDYLSLDVEGAEWPIIRTIPFAKVNIELIQLETNHLDEIVKVNFSTVKRYLEGQGYAFKGNGAIDAFFQKIKT